MNKIFVYLTQDDPGYQSAVALTEDGIIIAAHLSSSIYWSEKDMGLDPTYPSNKREIYSRYYPSGYTLVNLLHATETELRSNTEFMQALDKHSAHLSDDPPE